jgi:hypothetical protein
MISVRLLAKFGTGVDRTSVRKSRGRRRQAKGLAGCRGDDRTALIAGAAGLFVGKVVYHLAQPSSTAVFVGQHVRGRNVRSPCVRNCGSHCRPARSARQEPPCPRSRARSLTPHSRSNAARSSIEAPAPPAELERFGPNSGIWRGSQVPERN